MLLFTPVSITPLIDTEDACFGLNASRPIAKGDLKWRDALLVAHRVNSNHYIKKTQFCIFFIMPFLHLCDIILLDITNNNYSFLICVSFIYLA